MDLFWVDDRLAVATRPRGGDWLEDDLGGLRGAGVELLVSCLEADEEVALSLEGEATCAATMGLAFLRLRIPDRGTPSDVVAAARVLASISAGRAAGRRVAVHCRAGLGRSPMVAAAALVAAGSAPDAAWAAVEAARGRPVPDTDAQRAWVDGLGGHAVALVRAGIDRFRREPDDVGR